jgi:hypothetical protein
MSNTVQFKNGVLDLRNNEFHDQLKEFGYDLPTGRQRRCISTIIKAFLHMYFQIQVERGRKKKHSSFAWHPKGWGDGYTFKSKMYSPYL